MRFCPLCSGSSGNASYLEAGDVRLLIDAGLSCRRLCALLDEIGASASQLSGILVTHEHIDHVRGIDVLARRYDLPVYANAACFAAMRPYVKNLLPQNIRVFESDKPFLIGKLTVLPFTTPHDAAHSVGYRFTHEGRSLAVVTDLGHMDGRLLGLLDGVSLLLIEANHDVDMLMSGDYPYALKKRILSANGHLCNEDCGLALAELYAHGAKTAILGHLSKENNTPALALVTVESELKQHGVPPEALRVLVAKRDEPTGYFTA